MRGVDMGNVEATAWPVEAQMPVRGQVKRGGQLKRKTPLRAKRMARKPSTTKHARRERSPEFMGWTKRQPCIVRRFWQRLHELAGNRRVILESDLYCDGQIQADHAGNRFTDGDGVRAHDRTTIPMCMKHHGHRTSACGTPGQAGIFAGFTAEMVRAWSNEAIRIHHELARRAGIQIPNC